jgi:Glycine-zipper domain
MRRPADHPVLRDMGRFALALVAAGWIVAAIAGSADAQYSYHYPPPGYRPPPNYGPPPCAAVTPGPFAGAARGAAGGALFGAIAGNAGRGAAIGAAIGGVGGAIRRGTARSSGACY